MAVPFPFLPPLLPGMLTAEANVLRAGIIRRVASRVDIGLLVIKGSLMVEEEERLQDRKLATRAKMKFTPKAVPRSRKQEAEQSERRGDVKAPADVQTKRQPRRIKKESDGTASGPFATGPAASARKIVVGQPAKEWAVREKETGASHAAAVHGSDSDSERMSIEFLDRDQDDYAPLTVLREEHSRARDIAGDDIRTEHINQASLYQSPALPEAYLSEEKKTQLQDARVVTRTLGGLRDGDTLQDLNPQKLILFQMPLLGPTLPSPSLIKTEDDSGGIVKAEADASGMTGWLNVHESGRLSLTWAGLDMDVTRGSAETLQDVVLIGSDNHRACHIGQICEKLIITPDIDSLLQK